MNFDILPVIAVMAWGWAVCLIPTIGGVALDFLSRGWAGNGYQVQLIEMRKYRRQK